MSRNTIVFLNLQITITDTRPHIKWGVSLVIAYGHFNLPQGFCVGMNWLTIIVSPLRDAVGGRKMLEINMQPCRTGAFFMRLANNGTGSSLVGRACTSSSGTNLI